MPVYPKVRTRPALTRAKHVKLRKRKHHRHVRQPYRTVWRANGSNRV